MRTGRVGRTPMSGPPNNADAITVRRTELAGPAHSLKMMAKAAASEADEVIFDLEDGCAPSQKVAARTTLVEAFTTLNFRVKIRPFRANGVHTKCFYLQVIDLVD